MYKYVTSEHSKGERDKNVIIKSVNSNVKCNIVKTICDVMPRSQLVFEDNLFISNNLREPDNMCIAMFKKPEASASECTTRQCPYDRNDTDFLPSGFWAVHAAKLVDIVMSAQKRHECESVDQCMLPYLEPTDILTTTAQLNSACFRNRVIITGNFGGLDLAAFLDTGAQFNVLEIQLAHYLKEIGFQLRESSKRATSFTGHSIPILGEMLLPVLIGPSISLQKFVLVKSAPALITLGQPYLLTTRSLIRNDQHCVDIQSTLCPTTYGSVPWLTENEVKMEMERRKRSRLIPRFVTHVVENAYGTKMIPPKSTAWLKLRIPGYDASFTAQVSPNPFYLNPKGLIIPDSVTFIVKGECFINVANTLDEAVFIDSMDVLVTLQMLDNEEGEEVVNLSVMEEEPLEECTVFRSSSIPIQPDATVPDHCVPPDTFAIDEEYEERNSTTENIDKLNEGISMLQPSDFKLNKRANMSDDQKDKIMEVINKYRHVFTSDKTKLGRIKLVKHSIETGDCKPIKQRPYVVAQAMRPEVDQQIAKMLKSGIIRMSNSPWASPMVVVRKTDGSHRICIDFRKVNSVTVKDVFPLPRIQEVVDRLSGCQWISTFDMANGYWQITMDENDQHKTAFICHAGLFEWTVMPFGLTNAPATFQRLSEAIFAGVAFRQPYFDDVMIFSKNFTDHLIHLDDTLMQCHLTGAMFKTEKSEIAQQEVHLMGFIAGIQGIRTDPIKVTAVQQFPRPRTSKNIKQFLGLCGYYRQFVPDFSTIAEPLTALLKKGKQFFWTEECERAFLKLRKQMADTGTLAYPNFNKPFVLATDASTVGLGAVLEQLDGETMKPIMYISRTLNPHERNYSATDLECLAVIWAITKLRVYLFGREFEIVTDHSALQWLLTTSTPSGRTGRWALQLQEFDFKIRHRPGAANILADALSRAPTGGENAEEKEVQLRDVFEPILDELVADVSNQGRRQWGISQYEGASDVGKRKKRNKTEKEILIENTRSENQQEILHQIDMEILGSHVNEAEVPNKENAVIAAVLKDHTDVTPTIWEQHQKEDPFCRAMVHYLNSKVVPRDAALQAIIPRIAHDFCITERILKHTYVSPLGRQNRTDKRIVVPRKLVQIILEKAHSPPDKDHQDFYKTYDLVGSKYFWLTMAKDISECIAKCRVCSKTDTVSRGLTARLKPPPAVDGPFDRVGIDFIGPLTPTKEGYKYIILFTDYLTRWPEAAPARDCRAITIAKIFIEHIFCRFGAPREILTDKGTRFTEELFTNLMQLLGIRHKMTVALHPQTHEPTEKFNGTICKMLTTYLNTIGNTDWKKHISLVLGAYRFVVQQAIGYSPFQLLMGFEPRMPDEETLRRRLEQYVSGDEYFEQFIIRLAKLRDEAKAIIDKEQIVQHQRHDDSEPERHKFEVNQIVTLRSPRGKQAKTAASPPSLDMEDRYRITDICRETDTVKLAPVEPNTQIMTKRLPISRIALANDAL